jgi:dynein heavy chain
VQRGYGVNEFHEDLKGVLMSAGAENLQTVFLFSDSQVHTHSLSQPFSAIHSGAI